MKKKCNITVEHVRFYDFERYIGKFDSANNEKPTYSHAVIVRDGIFVENNSYELVIELLHYVRIHVLSLNAVERNSLRVIMIVFVKFASNIIFNDSQWRNYQPIAPRPP